MIAWRVGRHRRSTILCRGLLLADMSILIPLDRTVASLQIRSELPMIELYLYTAET